MQEKEVLLSLDMERFTQILSNNDWSLLRNLFKSEISLSQSFLIQREDSGTEWLLVDFENERTYSIDSREDLGNIVPTTDQTRQVHVSEVSDLNEEQKDFQSICNTLLSSIQSIRNYSKTHAGSIDLLIKLDLNNFDLDSLKRSDLSTINFDFESEHRDLVVIHRMFCEILNSDRGNLLSLSSQSVDEVWSILSQFYEQAQSIKDFNVSGDNLEDRYASLSRSISSFCNNAKSTLILIISYLKSMQVEIFNTQFETLRDDAENKLTKINNDIASKQQVLEDLTLQIRNRLAETVITPYAEVFNNQANKHQVGVKRWFWGTIGLAGLFAGIFFWVWHAIKPSEDVVSAILQNFFIKGFLLSLFYMLINRSIRNYAAEKHLEIVNRHRQNALATFEAFAEASGDNQETRDRVLLAATDAIFDANQSGYLSPKATRSDNPSSIRNVIRAVLPDK